MLLTLADSLNGRRGGQSTLAVSRQARKSMQPPTFMQKAAPESAGLVGNSTVRPDRCVPCWLYPSAMGKARCESCCFTTYVVRLLVRIPFGSSEFNGRCHHTRRFCRIVTRPPLRRPDCPWPSTPSLRNYTGRSILRPLRLRRSWKSPPSPGRAQPSDPSSRRRKSCGTGQFAVESEPQHYFPSRHFTAPCRLLLEIAGGSADPTRGDVAATVAVRSEYSTAGWRSSLTVRQISTTI
jgi:hypothetical protein